MVSMKGIIIAAVGFAVAAAALVIVMNGAALIELFYGEEDGQPLHMTHELALHPHLASLGVVVSA